MRTGATWLTANVNGVPRLPEKGLWGTCRSCGGTMISYCGSQVVDHWEHKAGSNCDPWHEGPGPWHREWQDRVQPEYVEVRIEPHCADIVGIDDCVIELQHSPISPEEIAEREEFYGNMVWVFDATERFEMITVGRRTFFAFRRTRHIEGCTKPVFLDFGSVLVEVEEFSAAVAKLDGFGRTRSREWFVERFLSDRLKAGATPRSFQSARQCRWFKDKRFSKTEHASQWNDPETNAVITVPKGAVCIPMNWYFKQPLKPRVYEWERIVEQHPQIANGWTKTELVAMQESLSGQLMILDGLLRVMPGPADKIKVDMTVSATRGLLARLEEHITAGRVPILKEATKQQFIKSAEAYERREYGDLLQNQMRGSQYASQERRLFE